MTKTPSLQDSYYANGTCFGCGPRNAEGLQLKSFVVDHQTKATWQGGARYDNGFGFLNGGIISALLDCHSAACMMKETIDRYGDFSIEDNEHFGIKHPVYLTHQIAVTFHRPAPLDEPALLVAKCLRFDEAEGLYRSELHSRGKLAAHAEVRWKRFHIRRE